MTSILQCRALTWKAMYRFHFFHILAASAEILMRQNELPILQCLIRIPGRMRNRSLVELNSPQKFWNWATILDQTSLLSFLFYLVFSFPPKKCAFYFKKNAILCLYLKNVSPAKRVVCFILNNLHFPMVEGIALCALYKSRVLTIPCTAVYL